MKVPKDKNKRKPKDYFTVKGSILKSCVCQAEQLRTYFGSGGPSDSGFIDSLHNDLNTRKASFCKMWENLAPGEGPEEFPDS